MGKNFNKGWLIDVFYFDFQKAFDDSLATWVSEFN